MSKVPVEISARHLHLSLTDLEALFGSGYRLKKIKALSQPGEFAAQETIDLIGPKSTYKNVRVVGPVRINTQVEITATDCHILGINAPIKVSGEIKDSASAILQGPQGQIKLNQGVIIAQRHLHLSLKEAGELGLKNNQSVSIAVFGTRSVTFHQVIVRAGDQYKKACHLDTDEANAAGLKACGYGELIK